jgi:hypothetical protein
MVRFFINPRGGGSNHSIRAFGRERLRPLLRAEAERGHSPLAFRPRDQIRL